MASKPAKRTRKRYSPVEVDTALAVLAFYGGDSGRASQETGIEDSLLRRWRLYTYRERYEKIAQDRGPELEGMALTHSREIMLRAGHVEHRILDELDQDGLTSKERAELAGAFQRVTTAKGINVDKVLTWTGRPREYIEHRDGSDILRALGAKIPGLVMEASATEIREPALPASQQRQQRQQRSLLTVSHVANARDPASQQG